MFILRPISSVWEKPLKIIFWRFDAFDEDSVGVIIDIVKLFCLSYSRIRKKKETEL